MFHQDDTERMSSTEQGLEHREEKTEKSKRKGEGDKAQEKVKLAKLTEEQKIGEESRNKKQSMAEEETTLTVNTLNCTSFFRYAYVETKLGHFNIF